VPEFHGWLLFIPGEGWPAANLSGATGLVLDKIGPNHPAGVVNLTPAGRRRTLLPGFAKKNLLGKRRRVSISWVSRFIGGLSASEIFYHSLERNSSIISGNFPWLPVDNFPGRPYLMQKAMMTRRKRRWPEKC
jgi:hypothetical protein